MIKDLSQAQRKAIYGSRFHHKIKRDLQSGKIKSLKTRLVVMGNQMKKGEAYVDAFAPVPRSTAGCILMSIAAALNLEMHACDLSQAFIQASWADLPEDVPQFFIRPPAGWPEEEDVVYEVLRPLYGAPNSGRTLHYTLDKFMRDNSFVKSGFEESVWIRYADEELPHTIMMSDHVNDTLILCKNLDTLQKFKT
eukprot:3941063-Rhodomonas_salina.1